MLILFVLFVEFWTCFKCFMSRVNERKSANKDRVQTLENHTYKLPGVASSSHDNGSMYKNAPLQDAYEPVMATKQVNKSFMKPKLDLSYKSFLGDECWAALCNLGDLWVVELTT